MKLFSLLPVVNLSAPVKSTEFAAHDGKVDTKYLQKHFASRFPPLPQYPNQHPALTEDPSAVRRHRFLSEMRLGDADMMRYALTQALLDDQEKVVTARIKQEEHAQELAEQSAIDHEKSNLQLRIEQTWKQRFLMETMFRELKIRSLDEFKQRMHEIQANLDTKAHFQRILFKRQAQLDPMGRAVSQLNYQHQGFDTDLARLKIDTDQMSNRKIIEMRTRLAEQLATLEASAQAQNLRSSAGVAVPPTNYTVKKIAG